jgi:uncharacterized protein (DUF1697 family)
MEITITKSTYLKDIQNVFMNQFPFLKIEFYTQFHKAGAGSTKKEILDTSLSVGNVSTIMKDGSIVIENTTKVAELEKAFQDVCGLSVQVFRKSNNLWLQTTITDNWTLLKQNQNAMEMDIAIEITPAIEDIHEQE